MSDLISNDVQHASQAQDDTALLRPSPERAGEPATFARPQGRRAVQPIHGRIG